MHIPASAAKRTRAVRQQRPPLVASIGVISTHLQKSNPPRPGYDRPVFILSPSWRCASTLLQSLLISSTQALISGEPNSRCASYNASRTVGDPSTRTIPRHRPGSQEGSCPTTWHVVGSRHCRPLQMTRCGNTDFFSTRLLPIPLQLSDTRDGASKRSDLARTGRGILRLFSPIASSPILSVVPMIASSRIERRPATVTARSRGRPFPNDRLLQPASSELCGLSAPRSFNLQPVNSARSLSGMSILSHPQRLLMSWRTLRNCESTAPLKVRLGGTPLLTADTGFKLSHLESGIIQAMTQTTAQLYGYASYRDARPEPGCPRAHIPAST